jgi:hypothetical protein
MDNFLTSLAGALKSKTVWFNIITGAMELANAFTGTLPQGSAMVINVVGNIILRFLTTQSLATKGQ